jgi:tartrate dehydrogenase/decarboxylase / D-malate dehydrogenase
MGHSLRGLVLVQSECMARAPDINGKLICNPIGQIWSAALMLEHLGEVEAGKAIVDAIETTLLRESGPKTRDMGGQAGTADVGTALAQLVAG